MIDKLLENQFFTGMIMTGLIGTAIMFGRKAYSSTYNYIRRKLLFTITVESSDVTLYRYLNKYLYANCYKQFRNVMAVTKFRNDDRVINDNDNNKTRIKYIQHTDVYYIKHFGTWIKVSKDREKLDGAQNLYNTHIDRFTLTSFNRKKLQSLIEHIHDVESAIEENNKTVNIYVNDYSHFRHNKVNNARPLDAIILDEEVKQDLIADLEEWRTSKQWCYERNIKHKRGYELSGSPGNGKSSLISAIANHMQMDLYVINLAGITSDNAYIELMNQIPENSIIVMEDIDAIWHKRVAQIEDYKVSFSAFINVLDGLTDKEGCLLFITTNKPEVLDEALVRPGRIDKRYTLINPTKLLVEKYLHMFYNKQVTLTDYTLNLSFAQLRDLCLQNKNNMANVVKQLELC